MKLIALSVLFAVVALAQAGIEPREICTGNNEHDLVEGCTTYAATDKILMRKTVTATAAFLQVTTRTLRFPDQGQGTAVIHCIRVRDLVENGHGGCPEVLTGGVDFKEATLKFTSQRGREMKFAVEIWGA